MNLRSLRPIKVFGAKNYSISLKSSKSEKKNINKLIKWNTRNGKPLLFATNGLSNIW